MYKTGDYARLLDDGCVDCFGRKDGQIKINGQRIETGEIEQRLLECSGIIEAVVVPYRVRETLHIAAVVCVNDSYDEVEVRGQLADRLPPFAIPESLVVVTEIAKSHSGKADLAQLRYLLPATQCNAVSTTISEVHSDMEHALHAIWQRVLDRQDIDSNASFFALGGTSLDTIRVKGDIKRQLGLEIDITDLFKYPTLTALAHFLDTAVSPEDAIPTRAVVYSDMRWRLSVWRDVSRCGEYCSVVDAGCRRNRD